MYKYILGLFLLVASIANAQMARYNDIVLWNYQSYAKVASGATITVCIEGASGIPCTSKVSLWQDKAGTVPLSNPTYADNNGNVGFYIAPGTYTITVTGNNIVGYSYIVTIGLPSSVAPNQPVDAGITYNGILTGSLTVLRHPWPFAVDVPINCGHSKLVAETAPSDGSAVFSLQKCTISGAVISCSEFGTATIAVAEKVATFACVSATSFAEGDMIKVIAPATPDSTLANIGGGIFGTRAAGGY